MSVSSLIKHLIVQSQSVVEVNLVRSGPHGGRCRSPEVITFFSADLQATWRLTKRKIQKSLHFYFHVFQNGAQKFFFLTVFKVFF